MIVPVMIPIDILNAILKPSDRQEGVCLPSARLLIILKTDARNGLSGLPEGRQHTNSVPAILRLIW